MAVDIDALLCTRQALPRREFRAHAVASRVGRRGCARAADVLKRRADMGERRVLVLGDLHLTRKTPRAVSDDLAALLAAHPGARVIMAGDLFDLSAEAPRRPEEQAIADVLEHHAAARPALAAHVDRGGELWLVGGNHDADLVVDATRGALVGALGLGPAAAARLRFTPWFFREGGLHVEHGHLYDPDNAPAHPLVVGEPSLGVHFVEEFIAKTGAFTYLHRNDQPPLKLFLSAFTLYGPRAPLVIFRYFHAATAAMLKSGPRYRGRPERERGEALVARFAEEVGVPAELIGELVALGAKPTLESLSATFTRLYFDRVLATLAMAGGALSTAAGSRRGGPATFGLGVLAMVASWAKGHDRYAGTVAERLSRSARAIADKSGARLVVFGHTHREALEERYANTASFAFPAGSSARPYLEIAGNEDRPVAVRRYFAARAAA
jgi:UDP-2,3-diacylglucosamine pyrophosphatase LpxH